MLQTECEKLNHDTNILLVKRTREDWIILEKKQVLSFIFEPLSLIFTSKSTNKASNDNIHPHW